MRALASAHQSIDLDNRPFAFVASAAEFAEQSVNFDGGFILWADTENVLTSAAPVNLLSSSYAALTTAFTVVKKVKGDNDFTAHDLVIDECELLCWQLLQQIEKDAEPGGRCTALSFIDASSIAVERDGPYFNEHFGATARLVVHISGAIPPYNPAQWNFTP